MSIEQKQPKNLKRFLIGNPHFRDFFRAQRFLRAIRV